MNNMKIINDKNRKQFCQATQEISLVSPNEVSSFVTRLNFQFSISNYSSWVRPALQTPKGGTDISLLQNSELYIRQFVDMNNEIVMKT